MDSVEAEGSSIDEAIARAVARLGVGRDRVAVEILASATSGFLGFGAKPARVRATLRRWDAEGVAAPAAVAAPSPPSSAAPVAGARAVAPRRRQRATSPPQPARDAARAEAAPPPERPPVSDATLEHARTVLSEIVRLSGATATVEIARDEHGASLVIQGDPSGVLIGRGGQTLDALEFLVGRIVGEADAGAARLTVDANGYRARQRATLAEQARRLAARVRASGRPQSFDPLAPRDRRVVHLALRDDATVTTYSPGSGYLRKLVIAPAGRRRKAGPGS